MNKQEILKKAEGILEEEKRIRLEEKRRKPIGKEEPKYKKTCLQAGICPNCGSTMTATVVQFMTNYIKCSNFNCKLYDKPFEK